MWILSAVSEGVQGCRTAQRPLLADAGTTGRALRTGLLQWGPRSSPGTQLWNAPDLLRQDLSLNRTPGEGVTDDKFPFSVSSQLC